MFSLLGFIQVRNRHIVDRSDFVVFWVERKSGGAYQTMRYAQKAEKDMINLAEQEEFIKQAISVYKRNSLFFYIDIYS